MGQSGADIGKQLVEQRLARSDLELFVDVADMHPHRPDRDVQRHPRLLGGATAEQRLHDAALGSGEVKQALQPITLDRLGRHRGTKRQSDQRFPRFAAKLDRGAEEMPAAGMRQAYPRRLTMRGLHDPA